MGSRGIWLLRGEAALAPDRLTCGTIAPRGIRKSPLTPLFQRGESGKFHEPTDPSRFDRKDRRMKLGLGGFLIVTLTFIVTSSPASAQQKKLRPLRIALPSHSVSSTPIYIARSLGIFESLGFEPQILGARAPGGARCLVDRRSGFLHRCGNYREGGVARRAGAGGNGVGQSLGLMRRRRQRVHQRGATSRQDFWRLHRPGVGQYRFDRTLTP